MATKSDFIVKSGIRVSANATISGDVSANVFSGNGVNLTSVNASSLGGVAAASYVQNTDSRTLSGNLVFSGANSVFNTQLTVNAAVINSTGVYTTNLYGNLTGNVAATTLSGNLTGNVVAITITGNLTGNVVATSVNTTTVNASANIVVGANVLVNTSTLSIGNSTAKVYVNSTAFVGNTTGVHTGNVAATTLSGNLTGNVVATTISGNLTGNVAATTLSGNLTGNVVATTISGNLTGNVVATTISGNLTGNVTSTVTTASANVAVGSNVYLTTSSLFIGNSTVNSTVNSTSFSGTAANSTLLNNKTEGNLNVNSAINANNADYLDGQHGSYYTNATNITTGTLPYAQIPANIANTTGAFTFSGVHTYSANIVLGSSGLSANGQYGTAGHVLHSNGTATYWAADDQGVTSVTTGNGLTGGTFTTTGTISALANTGIVANATGLYVNASYIATIASNSATYANASITNTFTVGTGTYFVSNGNVGIGNTVPVHALSVNGAGYFAGSITVSANNLSGGGIILSDDGDIVDLNDGYASMRFSSGVRIYSGNKTGSATITFSSAGSINAASYYAGGTLIANSSGIVSVVPVAYGGTGASDAATARTNLGLAIGTNVQAYDAGLADIANLAVTDGNFIVANGTNWIVESGATARTSLGLGTIATQASSSVSITGGSITGITDLAIADGGTGASDAATARTNLNVPTRTGGDASGTWGINVTGSAGSASTATNASYCYNYTQGFASNWNTDFNNAPAGSMILRGDTSTGSSPGGPGGTWWFQQNYRHTNGANTWGVQVAWGWEDNANLLRTRNVSSNTYSSWVTYLNSSNYNSYSPTLTGTGASGTWGINISGSAASLGGVAAANYARTDVADTFAGRVTASASQSSGSLLTATGSLGGIELANLGGANAAFMCFHRVGLYASYFGIDTDNQFAVGGWSAGAALGNMKVGSLGVGTAASGTAGEIRATNNITAYYSDKRLKKNIKKIENALDKVNSISGVTFQSNEEAAKYGYTDTKTQVGVIAQEIESVLPEVVVPAPFDIGQNEDGTEYSISGENYKTVQYEKLVPLLIESIKELKKEIDILKAQKGN